MHVERVIEITHPNGQYEFQHIARVNFETDASDIHPTHLTQGQTKSTEHPRHADTAINDCDTVS